MSEQAHVLKTHTDGIPREVLDLADAVHALPFSAVLNSRWNRSRSAGTRSKRSLTCRAIAACSPLIRWASSTRSTMLSWPNAQGLW